MLCYHQKIKSTAKYYCPRFALVCFSSTSIALVGLGICWSPNLAQTMQPQLPAHRQADILYGPGCAGPQDYYRHAQVTSHVFFLWKTHVSPSLARFSHDHSIHKTFMSPSEIYSSSSFYLRPILKWVFETLELRLKVDNMVIFIFHDYSYFCN
jgi:hypothetical protein